MAYDVLKGQRVRVLSVSGGDYTTLAAAIADSANWDTLRVGPGTYSFSQETLPANKAIVGDDRDTCILATTLSAAAWARALTMGNQSALRNLYLRGNAAGVNAIALIYFSAASSAQYVTLDNVRIDNGGGTQAYGLQAAVRATNCLVTVYNAGSSGIFFDPSYLSGWSWINCYFTCTTTGGGIEFWQTTDTCILDSCVLDTGAAVNSFWLNMQGAGTLIITGCTFVRPSQIFRNGGAAGSIYLSGNNLGGPVSAPAVLTTTNIYARGNTNYGTLATAIAVWKSIDAAVTRVVSTTPLTLDGWEGVVIKPYTGGAMTLTLPACANYGSPFLAYLTADTYGPYWNVTLNRASTDTYDFGATSWLIREPYPWAWQIKDENPAPDQWHLVAASRMTYAPFYGQLETNGFFQRGNASADGALSLQGGGILGNITSSGLATWNNSTSGYMPTLQLTTAAVAGSTVYWTTAAPSGPFSGAANWDFAVYISVSTSTGDRIAIGLWDKTGRLATDVFASNDPNGPHVLFQKIDGTANFRFAVRDDTVGAGGTQTTAAFTATGLGNRYIVLSKRGTTFSATLFDYFGAALETAVVSKPTFLTTASLCVVAGMNDIAGGGAHYMQTAKIEARQIPSTLPY